MALNAFGAVPYAVGGAGGARMGRFGVMPGQRGPRPLGLRARPNRRMRGLGDLVEEQVRNPRRLIPPGRRYLGDLVEEQVRHPRGGLVPSSRRFLGDLVEEQVVRGPRRLIPPGRRFLGLDEFEGAPWRHGKGPRKGKAAGGKKRKGKCAGRAVKCKMVPTKGGKKRRMCWDAKGLIAKTPKRKKRK